MTDLDSMTKPQLAAEGARLGLGTPAALLALYRTDLIRKIKDARKTTG